MLVHQRLVFAFRRVGKASVKVEDDHIRIARRPVDRLDQGLLLAQSVQNFLDGLVLHRRGFERQAQLAVLAEVDLGYQGNGVAQHQGAAADHVLQGTRGDRIEGRVFQRLAVDILTERVERFVENGFLAVALQDDLVGCLARTEPGDLGALAHAARGAMHGGLDLIVGDLDRQLHLALGQILSLDLERRHLLVLACRRGDPRAAGVGKEGLEPSRLAARDSKSRLSANSSTSPNGDYNRRGGALQSGGT
ncbi:MAG: hypothetical protein HW375_1521 [Anaerolineales bacterium]|nr:hypothetical protein [Anaerolineales bacterium]